MHELSPILLVFLLFTLFFMQAIGLFGGSSFGLMGLFGGRKILPYSHLSITKMPEYLPWGYLSLHDLQVFLQFP